MTKAPSHRGRPGFSLIELLLVIAVILILIALLIPAASAIRNQSLRASTTKLISELSVALDAYRDNDAHHFYPTPNPAHYDGAVQAYYLDYNPSDPASTLVMLERQTALVVKGGNGSPTYGGYDVSHEALDPVTTDATYNCLVDPWQRPIWYWLDGPYYGPDHLLNGTLMNNAPDRPAGYTAAVTAAGGTIDWNPRGTEPFAYLWSAGQPHNNATDLLPANYANWIYVKSTP